jgi:phosphopantothenoylcysteine decarboxylase/phosphopantothenate--cysteine ligase
MCEPAEIVEAALRVLRSGVPVRDLDGQRVLVTAGPTYEAADPARGLTNRSSGQMGFALAREAAHRGAAVTLVSGPVGLATPTGVCRVDTVSAAEMAAAVERAVSEVDVAVMCAAVADFTPAAVSSEKLKKDSGDGLTLELRRTQDILATLGGTSERPFLVGFAAESDNVEEQAAAKLESKGCDLIVANTIGGDGDAMGASDNAAVVLGAGGAMARIARAPKAVVATAIWDAVAKARGAGANV